MCICLGSTKTFKTRKNCFRYLKLMSSLNAAICTTISYTLWVEWYYLKNNYLTFRSKVKVSRRALRYVTHRLMVMHPHTNYHWPITIIDLSGKTKQLWPGQENTILKNHYLTLRSKSHEGHYGTWHRIEGQKSYGPDKLCWEEVEGET